MASQDIVDDAAIDNNGEIDSRDLYNNEVDRLAAKADFGIANAKGNYIFEEEFDDTLLDACNKPSSFPPKISKFEAADMMIQPQITVDKARNDVFSQYKLEHKLIMRMIGKLSRAAGGRGGF